MNIGANKSWYFVFLDVIPLVTFICIYMFVCYEEKTEYVCITNSDVDFRPKRYINNHKWLKSKCVRDYSWWTVSGHYLLHYACVYNSAF